MTLVHRSFLFDSHNRAGLPEVKDLIIDLSLNASGSRDPVRSLPISTNPVLRELKQKEPGLESVHTALLNTLNAGSCTCAMRVIVGDSLRAV